MPPRNKKAKLGEHTGENGTSSSRKKVIESLRGTLSYMVTDVPLELLAKVSSISRTNIYLALISSF